MTCIVATPRFVCADRRITDGGEVSSLVKVAKNVALIAAAAGMATSTQAVVRALRKGARSPSDLVEHVDKDSYALVLTASGRLWRVEDGQLWVCKPGTHAIGSGADLALGWLAHFPDPTIEQVRKAQRFVAKRRFDCGGGCDVRFFT